MNRFFIKKYFSIKLRAEICAKWGFVQKAGLLKGFSDYLNNKGMKNELTIKKIIPGNGEIFLFQEKDDNKNIEIFSNRNYMHPDAVNENKPLPDLYEDMKDKILI